MRRPFELAFRREFTGRWRELYAYLHRLTGDPDAAEDVAQEAFVRLYRRGAMPDDVGAWLVSVAHNLLRDTGRKRDRRRRLLRVRGEELNPSTAEPPPDAALELDEEGRAVRETLDRMPARQRQVLLLRASGMSYREIAAALEMPTTSVGKTLARALERFRRLHRETSDAPH